MTYEGTVQQGVIVLASGQVLPEGTSVQVIATTSSAHRAEGSPEPTIWEKLVALAEEVESIPCDLPADLAINHDHYLYGVPKRQ
jgi:hypothetical protein